MKRGSPSQEDGNDSIFVSHTSTLDEKDAEIEALRRKIREIEALDKAEKQQQALTSSQPKHEVKDAQSIYVGNVDYGSTPTELQEHFSQCGQIDRITILCDKWTGRPKGYAYVMFSKPEAVEKAIELDGKEFRGRPLKISPKTTFKRAVSGGRGQASYYGPVPRGRGRGRGRH